MKHNAMENNTLDKDQLGVAEVVFGTLYYGGSNCIPAKFSDCRFYR